MPFCKDDAFMFNIWGNEDFMDSSEIFSKIFSKFRILLEYQIPLARKCTIQTEWLML